MKEITIRLEDRIAGSIDKEAGEKGLTPGELCKYIIGSFVKQNLGDSRQRIDDIIKEAKETFDELEKLARGKMADIRLAFLKTQARDGALTCKNCTMKIKEEDIDAGKCGSCGTPLDAVTGGSQ